MHEDQFISVGWQAIINDHLSPFSILPDVEFKCAAVTGASEVIILPIAKNSVHQLLFFGQ